MDRREQLDDAQESLRLAQDGRQAQIWTACPGIVEAVNLDAMTLSVQPAINAQVTDKTGAKSWVTMPLLVDVPIQYPTAGQFALTLPVAAGDEVLVVFASRCIDAWWQSGGVQNQAELRMHDLSDGFAILGIKSLPNVIPNISSTTAQLRTLDGTTYVEIDNAQKVNVVAPVSVTIDTPTATFTGDVNVTGTVTADIDVIAGPGNVSLVNHVHAGSPTAPLGPISNTGAPI